jgi:hypothetical protein
MKEGQFRNYMNLQYVKKNTFSLALYNIMFAGYCKRDFTYFRKFIILSYNVLYVHID